MTPAATSNQKWHASRLEGQRIAKTVRTLQQRDQRVNRPNMLMADLTKPLDKKSSSVIANYYDLALSGALYPQIRKES